MKNSLLIGFAFLAATLCLSPSSAIAQRSQEPSQDTPVQSTREIRNEAPETARQNECTDAAEDVCGEGNVASVTFNSSTGLCEFTCKDD